MPFNSKISKHLAHIGQSTNEDIDILEAALTFGSITRINPELNVYRRHLDSIERNIRQYLQGIKEKITVTLQQEALKQIIASRYGYIEALYPHDTANNLNITHVIDQRSGESITLSILYIGIARRLGWNVSGIDFPNRFLVRIEKSGSRLIIDPFIGGSVLSSEDLRSILKHSLGNQEELKPQHYKEINTIEILLRLQTIAKKRLLEENRLNDVIQVIEGMKLFFPNIPELWREAGFLYAELNDFSNAISSLEEYLTRSIDDTLRYETSSFLQSLRQNT